MFIGYGDLYTPGVCRISDQSFGVNDIKHENTHKNCSKSYGTCLVYEDKPFVSIESMYATSIDYNR